MQHVSTSLGHLQVTLFSFLYKRSIILHAKCCITDGAKYKCFILSNRGCSQGITCTIYSTSLSAIQGIIKVITFTAGELGSSRSAWGF
jgi:hypothetical protein